MQRTPARTWTTLGLLSLALVIAYVDRVSFSVVLAVPEFTSAFGLGDADRGLLNSAFFWSYAVLQAPAGWLVDRYGTKWIYAAGFLMWSLVSAGTALADSLVVLFILRLLLGCGEAVVMPASQRWIRGNFEETARGLALGLYLAGSKFGPALGVWLSTALVVAWGWRSTFVVLGLGSLVWLVPWLLFARDGGAAPQPAARAAAPVTFFRILRSPAVLGLSLGSFCWSYCFYFYMTWMPAYFLEERNLSLNSMGFYSAFSFVGMAAVSALAGVAGDILVRRGANVVRVRRGFVIAGLAIASTEVLGAMSGSNALAVFFATLSLAGLGLAAPNTWALSQALIPASAMGRVAGIQNSISNLAGIAVAILTGWLKNSSGGYLLPMQTIWAVLIVGMAAYLFLAREKHVWKDAAEAAHLRS